MNHYETVLSALRRPRTLIKAAQHGASRYNRTRHLKFLNTSDRPKSHTAIIESLLAAEQTLEETRKMKAADYNVVRHVTVLTALIAEVQSIVDLPMAA